MDTIRGQLLEFFLAGRKKNGCFSCIITEYIPAKVTFPVETCDEYPVDKASLLCNNIINSEEREIKMTQTVNNAMAYIISLTPFVGYHNVPMAILTLLVDMNFQTHWDGFFYLRQAILIQSKHPGMRISAIYQEIARGLEDDYLSSRQIAQAIHASIADAFQNRNPDCWNKIFDEELWDSAPANNVFISRLGCLMELWDSRKEDLDGIE